MNAFWGVRQRKGELDDTIFAAAERTIWQPIFEDTNPEEIYLCHNLLRWSLRSDRRVVDLCHPAARPFPWLTTLRPENA
jgi:hypothetical protein